MEKKHWKIIAIVLFVLVILQTGYYSQSLLKTGTTSIQNTAACFNDDNERSCYIGCYMEGWDNFQIKQHEDGEIYCHCFEPYDSSILPAEVYIDNSGEIVSLEGYE